MDILDLYAMAGGIAQIFSGVVFYVRFMHKKVSLWFYLLSVVCGGIFVHVIRGSVTVQMAAYVLLLTICGMLLPKEGDRAERPRIKKAADFQSAVLYAVMVAEVMLLCYGVVKSLWSVFYPLLPVPEGKIAGYAFMLSGELTSLFLFWRCCHIIERYFFRRETIKRQYLFMVLIPVLMIFFMEEYINSIIYGVNITDGRGITVYTNHGQMLAIQLLGIGSLFCILYAWQKMLQSLRLGTELSLLEQQERYLNQYVEEARTRYEKTASFRHDVKNHIEVIRQLLQNGSLDQAIQYVEDLEEMAQQMSFPVSTHNPVADILVGNKLGIAKSMGIRVECSLVLPYPCGLRDIDICIILSNALDNAIHGCHKMEDGREKYIRMAGRMQGDFLLMEIENSFQGEGMFKEGTGLSNIRAVAEKYQGAVSVKRQGAVFLLHVLLIIPQHPESISQQMDLFDLPGGRKSN